MTAGVDRHGISMAVVRLSCLGQPNRKFAALSESGTRRIDVTAMQFREHAHQSETDAESGFGARSCVICLYEEIKNVRQHIVRNTDPRIPDAYDGVAAVRMNGQRQLTARVGVFRRVGEKVHEDLPQPARVGMQPYGRVRPGSGNSVIALI